jgi:UDPglucose 6-dehydrogenase/GDP-mannose 6-dehydrogenase
MRISIIGTGYVGLVTGACFAELGHQVICVDIDPAKIDGINLRKAPIHEAGLPEILERTVGKTLSASGDLAGAVAQTDITFIAVGTPASGGRIDLSFVERAAEEIGAAVARKDTFHTVVVKSTVVPGTTVGVVRRAVERTSGKQAGSGFGLGMNPEFLAEGTAVADFTNPDRIVVGGIDRRSIDIIRSVYESFSDTPMILTNTETAEMIKYASNSVLATLISFSNEFGRLCTTVGNVDVADVMRGVHAAGFFNVRGADGSRQRARITSFLEAGCGYGGSCLPKDVAALVGHAGSLGLEMPLLSSVMQTNRTQPDQVLTLIRNHYPSLQGVPVAILGLAFKPNTDDVRESPAFPIMRALRAAGAQVVAYDPVAKPDTHPEMVGVRMAASLTDAVKDADVVVHVTRWDEFLTLPDVLHQLRRKPLVIDGRRNLGPDDYERYEGVGRRMLARRLS